MTHLNYFQVHKNKKQKKPKYSDNLTITQKIGIEKCLTFFKEQTELLKSKK